MDSLINLNGISDVVNNLINKLSSAVGWVANRETPERIAINTFIEDIKKNSTYDAVTKAALISQSGKIIREYSRQAIIFNIAANALNENATPQDVDDDWLLQFSDKARLISDEEFQVIWGNILAEECNNPGSVPKSLLSILSQMDRNDAEAFSSVCSVSMYVMEKGTKSFNLIYISDYRDELYSPIGMTYDALTNLQSLGLIQIGTRFTRGPVYYASYEETPIALHYFDKTFEFPKGMTAFPCGDAIFTKSGQALCRAIEVDPQTDFFEKYCVPYFEEAVKKHEEEQQKKTI